jgi:hypothetical protein
MPKAAFMVCLPEGLPHRVENLSGMTRIAIVGRGRQGGQRWSDVLVCATLAQIDKLPGQRGNLASGRRQLMLHRRTARRGTAHSTMLRQAPCEHQGWLGPEITQESI